MITEAIGSLSGLEALEADWFALWRRSPRATPFQAPQWVLPWVRCFFEGGELHALAMREEGRLIGFAPLFIWGTERRTVSFLGSGISDYGDVLCEAGREAEGAAAVWRYLDGERGRWDVVDLQEVPAGSGLLDGRDAEVCSVCPVLEATRYPADVDQKHKRDVHRARNRLMANGGLEFRLADGGNFRECFWAFLGLYRARWGGFDARLERFHWEAAGGFMAVGSLRLAVLRVAGAAVATTYGFVSGGRLYCYLSGFDPAVAKLSPGAVLLGWVIDEAIGEGVEEIDFLRGAEDYKYLWGGVDRMNFRVRG